MHIMLCEADPRALGRLRTLIERSANESMAADVSIQCFDTLPKLLFALEDVGEQIDVMYLDISLSDDRVDSGKLVERIRGLGCLAEIVFLSSEEERWPEGYDVGAFHYLVKDKSLDSRLADVFKRVSDRIKHRKRKVVAFAYAGERVVIPLADILYFKSEGRMMRVFYKNDNSFEFYSRMNKIENTLIGEGFVRVHRSYLLNRIYLKDVQGFNGVLTNGEEIPLGRAITPALRASLSER